MSPKVSSEPLMRPSQHCLGNTLEGNTSATGLPKRVTRTGLRVRRTSSRTARQVALNREIAISRTFNLTMGAGLASRRPSRCGAVATPDDGAPHAPSWGSLQPSAAIARRPALASSWLRNPNRFPCSEAVQNIRAEVDSIGPDDRPHFGVHPDLSEEFNVLQWNEDPAAAGNPPSQVDLARSSVGETQRQAVLSGVPDTLYAWKHNHLLFQRPNPLSRLLVVQAVPVPHQFALM